jgi:hypothetical protein
MMRDHVEEIVLLEPLPDEARKLMSVLGTEPKTGEARGSCVVYVGRRIDLLRDLGGYSWAVVLGVATSSRLISIINEDESSRLGINMNIELHRKYEAYSRKASELENITYIIGRSSDLLLGDSKWRLGWVGRPLNDLGLNILIATTLALLARGVNGFNAISAAGYLAGIATSSGYDAAINELKRSAKIQ